MNNVSLAEILELDTAERIRLVEDIWDSVAAVPQSVTLTEKEKKELDHRIEAYHLNPAEGSPWPEVRKRIQRSA